MKTGHPGRLAGILMTTDRRKPRPALEADLTLDVEYMSEPEAACSAHTQYETIREVLEWLRDNPQGGLDKTDPPASASGPGQD